MPRRSRRPRSARACSPGGAPPAARSRATTARRRKATRRRPPLRQRAGQGLRTPRSPENPAAPRDGRSWRRSLPNLTGRRKVRQSPDGMESAGGDELFATETMAELCARQGRVRDAAGIYRRLLAGAPDEERRARWTQRLETLAAARDDA